MQRSISLGKWRRLQQASGTCGTFTVLAIDHRGPLRRALEPEAGAGNVDNALTSLKRDIVRELAPVATAVLLDPETGLQPCLADGALPGSTGLLVALDTGSTGDPAILETGLVPDWSVERILATGAAGVKLLVYYHPDTPEAAWTEQLVAEIAQACVRHDLPFYLEPLSYSPRNPGERLTSNERRRVVLESACRFVPLGVDVLKAEFPVDVREESDESVWRGACEELSENCDVPWVLLSAGASYEVFLRQSVVAVQAGASGVMVGRAVWKEAVTTDRSKRLNHLAQVGLERMQRLRSLCEALGKPFTEFFSLGVEGHVP